MAIGEYTIPEQRYERYLKSVTIDRDEARMTITWAAGPLVETKNAAGIVYHEPKIVGSRSLDFVDIVKLGGKPDDLMSIDNLIERMGKVVHDALVAEDNDPLKD